MSDIAQEIATSPWEKPFQVCTAAGQPWDVVVKAIVLDRRPWTELRFAPAPPLPDGVVYTHTEFWFGVQNDSNPWDDASDIACAMGMRLYCDGDVCVLELEEMP